MPVNYQLGKIYTLVNNVNNIIYVGSTSQKLLSSRMSQHRIHANKPGVNSTLYTAMRALGLQNFSIVLHNAFPCNSRDELEADEYKTLQQFIVAGTPHYNTRMNKTGWKATDETKQKVSATKIAMNMGGENHPGFSYGNVRYRTSKRGFSSWQFQWVDNGKQRCRKTIYAEYGTEEDVWCDDLGHIEW